VKIQLSRKEIVQLTHLLESSELDSLRGEKLVYALDKNRKKLREANKQIMLDSKFVSKLSKEEDTYITERNKIIAGVKEEELSDLAKEELKTLDEANKEIITSYETRQKMYWDIELISIEVHAIKAEELSEVDYGLSKKISFMIFDWEEKEELVVNIE
jgi:hypothetical protein